MALTFFYNLIKNILLFFKLTLRFRIIMSVYYFILMKPFLTDNKYGDD